MGSDLVLLDVKTYAIRPWASIEIPAGWVLNDGSADRDGTLWIGSVAPNRALGSGNLYGVGAGGAVRLASRGVAALSNGIAAMTSGELLHADTITGYICLHTARNDPPQLVRSIIWADLTAIAAYAGTSSSPVCPDGLALDVAGGCWVAMYGRGEVWRIVDDRITHIIDVPTAQTTSVALGGPDGRDVLITTAHENFSARELRADRNAGRLFVARSPVPGLPVAMVRT